MPELPSCCPCPLRHLEPCSAERCCEQQEAGTKILLYRAGSGPVGARSLCRTSITRAVLQGDVLEGTKGGHLHPQPSLLFILLPLVLCPPGAPACCPLHPDLITLSERPVPVSTAPSHPLAPLRLPGCLLPSLLFLFISSSLADSLCVLAVLPLTLAVSLLSVLLRWQHQSWLSPSLLPFLVPAPWGCCGPASNVWGCTSRSHQP